LFLETESTKLDIDCDLSWGSAPIAENTK
jgi:hypothetical protein